MILIGIAGKKGSGKDEVFRCIKHRFPDSHREAFADALKDEVCFAMHVTREYLELHKSNFRLILQGWGTDYRRKLHGNDYWIRAWKRRVVNSSAEVVVVPDVRFLNEARLIHDSGGYLFKVIRPGYSEGDDTHPSETDLDLYDKFDGTILNDKPLVQLQTEVDIRLGMAGIKTV